MRAYRGVTSAVDRIPQYLLASYVGVAPEFLSRLERRRNGATPR